MLLAHLRGAQGGHRNRDAAGDAVRKPLEGRGSGLAQRGVLRVAGAAHGVPGTLRRRAAMNACFRSTMRECRWRVNPSRATVFSVAEQMGADFVVLGSYEVNGDQLPSERAVARCQEPAAASRDQAQRHAGGFCLPANVRWRGQLLQEMPNPPQVSEQQFVKAAAPIRLDAFENYIRGVVSTSRRRRSAI